MKRTVIFLLALLAGFVFSHISLAQTNPITSADVRITIPRDYKNSPLAVMTYYDPSTNTYSYADVDLAGGDEEVPSGWGVKYIPRDYRGNPLTVLAKYNPATGKYYFANSLGAGITDTITSTYNRTMLPYWQNTMGSSTIGWPRIDAPFGPDGHRFEWSLNWNQVTYEQHDSLQSAVATITTHGSAVPTDPYSQLHLYGGGGALYFGHYATSELGDYSNAAEITAYNSDVFRIIDGSTSRFELFRYASSDTLIVDDNGFRIGGAPFRLDPASQWGVEDTSKAVHEGMMMRRTVSYNYNGNDNISIIPTNTNQPSGWFNIWLTTYASTAPSGDENIIMGYEAGSGLSAGGSRNVGLGSSALYASNNSGASDNVGVGSYSLYNMNGVSANNTGVGSNALSGLRIGTANTGIGYNTATTNWSGDGNLFIGSYGGTRQSTISYSATFGYGAIVNSDRTIVLGDTSGVGPDKVVIGKSYADPTEDYELQVEGEIEANAILVDGKDIGARIFDLYDSTYWNDIKIPLTGLNTPAGLNAPDYTKVLDSTGTQGIYLPAFDDTIEEEMIFASQIPHNVDTTGNWDGSNYIDPHIHWYNSTNTTGQVIFGLEYSVATVGGTFDQTNSHVIYTAWPPTAGDTAVVGSHMISEFPEIYGEFTLSTMVIGRIFRATGQESPGRNGDIHGLEVDFHVRQTLKGTEQPYQNW